MSIKTVKLSNIHPWKMPGPGDLPAIWGDGDDGGPDCTYCEHCEDTGVVTCEQCNGEGCEHCDDEGEISCEQCPTCDCGATYINGEDHSRCYLIDRDDDYDCDWG